MLGGYMVIFHTRTAVGYRDVPVPIPRQAANEHTLLVDVIAVCNEIKKVKGNKLVAIVNSRKETVMEFKRCL